jgi:hypothetical protein
MPAARIVPLQKKNIGNSIASMRTPAAGGSLKSFRNTLSSRGLDY